ncbi:hypothetical protein RchiOBHm_Chr5g0071831 [Rosa chinensis]|uniref:Uncharacterized protein n=1 Tax=Rosa chinensis TaxID=74649 RepID=A0A2P6QKI1_ROSCH|nr:hypothetical protein RchiOBHm_Chr5g0071831 [Rosa chinensis]
MDVVGEEFEFCVDQTRSLREEHCVRLLDFPKLGKAVEQCANARKARKINEFMVMFCKVREGQRK